MNWWRVETSFAVCAVRTENGRIVEAAPIFQRWIGRELWVLVRAYDATVKQLSPLEGAALACARGPSPLRRLDTK